MLSPTSILDVALRPPVFSVDELTVVAVKFETSVISPVTCMLLLFNKPVLLLTVTKFALGIIELN